MHELVEFIKKIKTDKKASAKKYALWFLAFCIVAAVSAGYDSDIFLIANIAQVLVIVFGVFEQILFKFIDKYFLPMESAMFAVAKEQLNEMLNEERKKETNNEQTTEKRS